MATNNAINNTLPSGVTVTGTTNINTTGSSVTSINTGGTGATNIGNATGNTSVTGSLTATTTLTATAGAITAIDGNLATTSGDAVLGNTVVAQTAPWITFRKSRSGGVITSGDSIGAMSFQGIGTGTTYTEGASIISTSSGTIAANRVAANLVFATHPDSASGATATTRLTIASTGAVTIATPDSGVGLTVSGGGATVTSGDITVTSGNLLLPKSTSTVGRINITKNGANGSDVRIHNYTSSVEDFSLFIGQAAGNYTNSGYNNFGIGNSIFAALTSGQSNSGIGSLCLQSLTTGANNVAMGRNAMNLATTAIRCCAIGASSLHRLTTGAENTCIGVNSGYNYTGSESSNIVIGELYGTTGESNVIRIGTDAATGVTPTQTKCFIAGIRGITTVNADAIAVLIDSAGQLGTVSSSIKTKENIVDMEGESSRLMDLRPVTFSYKQYPGSKNYGLIAEEVLEIYPELVVNNKDGEPESIKYHELPALLLNEIQKLYKRVENLEAQLAVKEK